MARDSYRVEVLHYQNPHLLWVEVLDRGSEEEKFHFEQIGIYGVLPMVTTIDMERAAMEMKKSEEWVPAANIVLENLLSDAEQVWFCPTYVDRSSIFDCNTHKYGELIIKKSNGENIRIVEKLIQSRFASYDECSFRQCVSTGKFKTKLNIVNSLQVYNKLETCYEIRDKPRNLWVKSLKEQTSLLHAAVNLETSIDIRKFNVYNRSNVKILLENKLKDLQLCKDSDETSAGRANMRSKPLSNRMTSAGLKKKLQLLQAPKENKFSDISSSSSSVIMNKYFDNFDAGNDTVHNIYDGTDQNEKKEIEENIHLPKFNGENLIKSKEIANKEESPSKAKKPNAGTKDMYAKRVAYGPPGFNPSKLQLKVQSTRDESEEELVPDQKLEESKDDIILKTDISSEEDLDVGVKATNMKLKNDQLPLESSSKSTAVIKQPSSALQRKMGFLQGKIKKHDISTISGSHKDLVKYKQNFDTDDESISDLVEKLDLGPNNDKKDVGSDACEIIVNKTKINVNPFKNVDGSQSVFVDKLVSPILMVHTKNNNNIRPFCNMRDVPFGTDIHIVLKNMSIKDPMRLQTISWPTILRGHSLFLISPFGSGKTMGHLPAVCRLVADNKNISDGFGPSCIIVCATSKSVSDVEKVSKMCLYNTKVFACYAGIDDMTLTTSILNGCDLLICTPCMLVRLIQRDFGVDLRNLSTFVIDDCERLSKVYINELKFCLRNIKEMLKLRATKEWKVQYVVVSRIWCDFMKSLTKTAPDPVVCIGAFQECVLYSQCSTTVNFVESSKKLNAVINFLKNIDQSKKTVIACRSDDEVKFIEKALTKLNYIVFACDSGMTINDLYKLSLALNEHEEPVLGPILVCCDGNLTHLNVTDAHYLVHYSLPELFSMFCKRFSVLIDNYPTIFNNDDGDIKIKILLEDTNVEQLPKILNFIKRCTPDVPNSLDELSQKVLVEKDLNKAHKLVPLCTNLLCLGKCPDIWNCKDRHNIFTEYDEPNDWMPQNGIVTFRILHYHTAVSYSARLIANITQGDVKKIPQTYSLLSLKMGMYFSKEKNKKLHGTPVVGDICAVALKQNLFARCQVVKILRNSRKGTPHLILIKLIDEDKYEMTRDIYLYHLPDNLKSIETYVVHVVLSNIQPADRDITFSDLAKDHLKKITDKDVDLYMRGRISLVIGNCIFVDTLEACLDLSSLGEIVVKSDFKKELLNGHAIANRDHLTTLAELKNMEPVFEKTTQIPEGSKPTNLLPSRTWAHLGSDDFESVFFSSAESPDKFFVRLADFKDRMNTLLNDIKQYVTDAVKIDPSTIINIGDIVLAQFPDDGMYERARVDEVIDDKKVKCFFVDQGDWREVYTNNLRLISEKLITQMPFQAIECRLFGVKPAGNVWTDFSTHWFTDNCYDLDGNVKYLFAKHYNTDKAEHTGGNKYSVVLIDTTSKNDVIINQLMIDLNLAHETHKMEYLNEINFNTQKSKTSSVTNNYLETETFEEKALMLDKPKNDVSLRNLLQQPLRSVPLVDSHSSDDDKWNINMVDDFMPLFKSMADKNAPLALNDSKNIDTIADASSSKLLPPPKGISSLDSDDFASSECSDSHSENKNMKPVELRKPKLCWRQNKNTVTVKILLIGVEKYEMSIYERYIKFFAIVNDAKYGFEFELFGGIHCNRSSHSNRGQYILLTLAKLMQRNWLTLTNDGGNMKWIVYDVDDIDTSSDEELYEHNNLKNIIKANDVDSYSEDDFFDDANFIQRRE